MKTFFTFNRLIATSIVIVLLSSCAANKTASTTESSDDSDTISIKMDDSSDTKAGSVSSLNNNSMQLVDYLRRIPGLQIDQRGSSVNVMVRGMSSVGGNNSPLYVINNTAIGNSYADAVSAVDVNDIKTVNVIKGAEGQQMYGMRGSNGVIQIFTKKK
ncbi:MAG: TonB-dependent receptor plug domain-containing protein [Imperialibacter sp.]|uniref:TonB-dependent receptor plug domain-containing protein n=1 Tax=Imperialibacter sp. TaxID=2038411 RepID=UPI0032EC9974